MEYTDGDTCLSTDIHTRAAEKRGMLFVFVSPRGVRKRLVEGACVAAGRAHVESWRTAI